MYFFHYGILACVEISKDDWKYQSIFNAIFVLWWSMCTHFIRCISVLQCLDGLIIALCYVPYILVTAYIDVFHSMAAAFVLSNLSQFILFIIFVIISCALLMWKFHGCPMGMHVARTFSVVSALVVIAFLYTAAPTFPAAGVHMKKGVRETDWSSYSA